MYSLPAARLYDWATYCGVSGGIPTRTTVYHTVTSADTMTHISDMIAACTAGQVVSMAAGTYTGTLTINAASQVTLRGAGAGQTIISGPIVINGGYIPTSADSWSSPSTIASGYTKDSMTITLSSTPGASFAVGNLIQITQTDDYDLVWHRDGNWAGTKNLRFTTRITSVSGNDIGLAAPIPYTYVAAQSPICMAIATPVTQFGIEDLTISSASLTTMTGGDRCWFKDVEITGFSNAAITFWGCTQCEVNRCYLHGASGFPSDDGYWLHLQYGCSNFRVENNVAYQTSALILNSGAANFIGYNYAYDQRRTSHTWVETSYNSNHGPHSIMNLWEGNMGQRYQNDGYHGNASYQTHFREYYHGLGATGYTQERQLIDLVRGSYYESVVGCVLGDSSWVPTLYSANPSLGADHNLGYI